MGTWNSEFVLLLSAMELECISNSTLISCLEEGRSWCLSVLMRKLSWNSIADVGFYETEIQYIGGYVVDKRIQWVHG